MPSKTWRMKTATNKQQRGSPRPPFGEGIFCPVDSRSGYRTLQVIGLDVPV